MGPQQLLEILDANIKSLNNQLINFRLAGSILEMATTQEAISNAQISKAVLVLGMKLLNTTPEDLLIEFERQFEILSALYQERINSGNFENEQANKQQIANIDLCIKTIESWINALKDN